MSLGSCRANDVTGAAQGQDSLLLENTGHIHTVFDEDPAVVASDRLHGDCLCLSIVPKTARQVVVVWDLIGRKYPAFDHNSVCRDLDALQEEEFVGVLSRARRTLSELDQTRFDTPYALPIQIDRKGAERKPIEGPAFDPPPSLPKQPSESCLTEVLHADTLVVGPDGVGASVRYRK